ncbi:hypothetical protein PFICI_00983 [Pestalotiopsis fici W106-1]|uniref:Apple domain-containing protein n=1 Tax=Pestalotiopsis fici (strain W106-1 / CGMCC3.15140) TaxID=1229662 RepID=W3XMG3_PESFW|nr:uncharacterized protein PFICI_00983 [Pestalotiopsis fici W106-1]ETS87155.1 hypothetical protein PFICI_00983 [Pestalotiopsis fici W106-1]
MKSAIFALGFAALARAQSLDFDVIDSAPVPETTTVPIGAGSTTVAYNSATAAASAAAEITASPIVDDVKMRRDMKNRLAFDKRDGNCAVQPVGYGPVPDPDTPDAFLADTDFSTAAQSATTPSGFVQSFSNLQGSNSAYAYMGYTALKSYDAATCASKCKAISGCNAFNIYFERDPSLDPGSACPNPASTTVIKCVFWGGPVYSTNAKNTGQWRSSFEVVIAGSNGYNSVGPFASPTGYTGTYIGQKAINAPLCPSGSDSYLGVKAFTSGPFDPSLCAAACSAQSDYNRAHPASDGTYKTCQFYNTYMLIKNGGTGQQLCAMYANSWDASYATNNGQYRGSDHYTIEFSVTGSNSSTPATCSS